MEGVDVDVRLSAVADAAGGIGPSRRAPSAPPAPDRRLCGHSSSTRATPTRSSALELPPAERHRRTDRLRAAVLADTVLTTVPALRSAPSRPSTGGSAGRRPRHDDGGVTTTAE
jgi:hypothetical protein